MKNVIVVSVQDESIENLSEIIWDFIAHCLCLGFEVNSSFQYESPTISIYAFRRAHEKERSEKISGNCHLTETLQILFSSKLNSRGHTGYQKSALEQIKESLSSNQIKNTFNSLNALTKSMNTTSQIYCTLSRSRTCETPEAKLVPNVRHASRV